MTTQNTTTVLEDERVQEILTGLVEGKTRDELAIEFNHSNYKSLDIYMRRKGFTWDATIQNYVLKSDEDASTNFTLDTSKASHIVQQLRHNVGNMKLVATQFGFANHKELASYMAGHGYVWDSEENNYVKRAQIVQQEVLVSQVDVEQDLDTALESIVESTNDVHVPVEYLSLLKMLKQNEAKLIDILKPYGSLGSIPRYTIPGIAKTKTVQMVHSLDQMVVDFARERNMSQRDVFEVALLEFFKNYGYQQQVEQLLR